MAFYYSERPFHGLDTFTPDQLKILPLGALVAVARLVDCIPTEEMGDNRESGVGSRVGWPELYWGDFSAGRYAWRLENVIPVNKPIPMNGRQGLFNIRIDVKVDAGPGWNLYGTKEDMFDAFVRKAM